MGRKDERYNTRHSVLKGLAESGTTITTAGIIMTVAFAALMLSQITVLNQFGFLLVCVSVVDTFMVRAVLVPALMLLIGEKNWWPGKMPPGNHQIDAEGEDAWLLAHRGVGRDGVLLGPVVLLRQAMPTRNNRCNTITCTEGATRGIRS